MIIPCAFSTFLNHFSNILVMKYIILFLAVCFISCKETRTINKNPVFGTEKNRVLRRAAEYQNLEPVTVTASVCERSTGGKHDFYSEGDYWWPDPEHPEGPYIRKDGMTNPNNFIEHRKAMIRFGQIAGALASAYIITKDTFYVERLLPHLRAWFLDEETKMNPNLLYGQAIMGRVTGRGIGIIDTIHLLEVAKAVMAIEPSGALSKGEIKGIKDWFATYLDWMTTHPNGIAEQNNGNNHSVCWALQVAVFAELVENQKHLDDVRSFYKNTLLPDQMAINGSFPLEIKRTKPYGYSLFTLDAMTAVCQVASTPQDNLFEFHTTDGKGIAKGIAFLYPFTIDKASWPYKKDVMYWDEWPVRHPYLLFGGLALGNDSYLELWKTLDADFNNTEIIRNMPIRYPLLWVK